MRFVTLALLLFGALSLLKAGYDEWRGEAVAENPPGLGESSSLQEGRHGASKLKDPAAFRRLMNYEWAIGGLWMAAAVFAWGVQRKYESLDLFASDRRDESSGQNP